jgi:putative two-component system response regulator
MISNKPKMLVVDDQDINRDIITVLFEDTFDVLEASNGLEAIDIISRESAEIKIVLLDLIMPIMDGFGVLREMNRTGIIHNIPVILITSDEDDEKALESYGLGVSDVMHKPFNANIVKQRVDNIIELYTYKNHLEEKLVEQKNELLEQEDRIKQMNFSLIDTLSATVEFRNMESGQHIKRTRLLIRLILKQKEIREKYGFTDEQLDLISSAAALHDIGKISVPDAVLLKPGKLTNEEFDIMKQHTVNGSEMIRSLDLLQDKEYFQYCYDIARYHHERWDGRGYPDGLKGDEIPIWSQAAAVVDVYDALTSKRVYKDAFSHEKAIEMIVNGECGDFNPLILDVLLKVSEELRELASEIGN